jgi:hypothetical protein
LLLSGERLGIKIFIKIFLQVFLLDRIIFPTGPMWAPLAPFDFKRRGSSRAIFDFYSRGSKMGVSVTLLSRL